MNSGSSDNGLPNDKDKNESEFDFDLEFDMDFERWINEIHFDDNGDLVMNIPGVETTTITPTYPSQPTISTVNGGSSVGGSSENQDTTTITPYYPSQQTTSTINGGSSLGRSFTNEDTTTITPNYPSQQTTSTINSGSSLANVDTTTITPYYPSQQTISTINGGTSIGLSSSNQDTTTITPYYPSQQTTSTINGGSSLGLSSANQDPTTITPYYPTQQTTSTINGGSSFGGSLANKDTTTIPPYYPSQQTTATINGGSSLGSLANKDTTTVTPYYPSQQTTATINGGSSLGGSLANEVTATIAPNYMSRRSTSTINSGSSLGGCFAKLDSTTITPNYPNRRTTSTINVGSCLGGRLANQDTTTISPNYPSQRTTPTINGGSRLGGRLGNQETTNISPNYPSQRTTLTINGGSSSGVSPENKKSTQSTGRLFHEIITASRMTSNNSIAAVYRSGQILPDVPKFAFSSVVQTSQPRRTTDFPQNQPLLQQVFKNNAVQQPPTNFLSSQSNMMFGDQKKQLNYPMPSNQIVPVTRQVVNTQTRKQQNNQPSRRQIQQNPKQKQVQVQQGTGTSGKSKSGVRKRGNTTQVNLSAPVGFETPADYPSSLAWREYVLSQILIMKDKFFKELRTMHHNAVQFHNQAKNVEQARQYGNVQNYLEKMVAFLSITTIEEIPQNDDRVYNYMNVVVNYVNYHKRKIGGSAQSNPPSNSSDGITNQETNINFNQNQRSRKPRARGRVPGSLKNTSVQIEQNSMKPPQSSVNRSVGSPISMFSNSSATNLSSSPFNHQPPVANQNNLEKMKQPMQKANEFFLPPAAKSISQETTSPQWSPLSVSSSSFDVNTLLSPQAIARSPFLLSSTSTQSGGSPLSSLGSEKLITPVDSPCPEKPQESQDSFTKLFQVADSVSPKTVGTSLTNFTSVERIMDYVPPNIDGSYMLDDGDLISVYDPEAQSTMKRKLNDSSVYQDQDEFDLDVWDLYFSDTSVNKRPKIDNEATILEEIKAINVKLVETSTQVVSDSTEDNIGMLGGEEGTIVKCVFKNECFPDIQESASSEKMPEFVIQLFVPLTYPIFSPTILKSGRNVLSEPWEMLYKETMTRFDLLLSVIPGQVSLEDMAKNWDASARAVMSEFAQKRGEKSSSPRIGSWENCINSSSGSNEES